MTFEPKSGDHAIIEAVFGLSFVRPFSGTELDALASDAASFEPLFAKARRGSGIRLLIGAGFSGASPLAPPLPVAFDRREDEKLAWRLRAEGQSILLNCLVYTRWSDVWATGMPYLERAARALTADNQVSSIFLQYIDVFEWSKDAQSYDLKGLLRPGARVPLRTLEAGPLWHLHQGWFRTDPALPGRLLERINLDGLEEKVPYVKVDSYLQFDLENPRQFKAKDLTGKRAAFAPWFEALHLLDKELLKSVLAPKMAKRIKLDV